MNRRFLSILFTLLCTFQFAFSQQRTCHSHHYLEQQKAEDPQRAFNLQQIENQLQKFISEQGNAEMAELYSIPVVVHVIYDNANENISDAQIQSQMQVLNDDFRRLNSDANNTWSQAADSEIEFCLATVDPNGNPTTGITRTQTNVNSFSTNDNMKFNSSGGKDIWDRNRYLNMWVCQLSGGILGYAQFPGGPAATDGVVMDYRYFGTIGTATAPFDLGRTTTHEVGHWLNLYHIWGDGGCGQDDLVGDTPTSDAPNYGCATGHTSCGSTDMVENYMDYSDDGCMNLFTQGQKTRMRALFAAGAARASLLNSAACGNNPPPTCSAPTGLAANPATTTASVSWSAVSGANNYQVDTRPTGGNWSSQTVSGTSTNLTGLTACSNYEVRVLANCTAGASAFSAVAGFQTTGCATPCDTPTSLSISNIGDNTASASWSAASGAATYRVQVRQSGSTSWSSQDVNGTSINITGLSNCTGYDVRVRSNCASSNSSYTSISTFTTTGCSSGCNDNELTFTLVTDDYGSETTWQITDAVGTVLYSGGPYANNITENVDLCLPDACYDFTIFDSYGDGICCAWGNGSYQVTDAGGQVLISGGAFGSVETQEFCAGNGGGGGGGCTDVVIDFNNFDSGWGIWNDGGSDCRRSANDAAYAFSGSRCVRLRDNTNTSVMTTDNLNLSDAEEITVDFTYIARSMDNANEDFWLQISTNGGASYTTVEEWNRGDEFENNIREFDAVTISGPFSTNTRLRFRCDASGNSDWVYIDDVEISGCVANNNRTNYVNEEITETTELEVDTEEFVSDDIDLAVYPNPVTTELTIDYQLATKTKAEIFVTDFTGKVLRQIAVNVEQNQAQLDVSQFIAGYYLIHLVNGEERMTKKFVVMR